VTPGDQGKTLLTPKPNSGVDVRGLPIGPMEAFVLSRVDGKATESDIALVTGMSAAEVTSALLRLASLGAITYGDADARSSPHATAKVASGPAPRVDSQPRVVTPPLVEAPAAPEYDPAELEAPADLDEDKKRLILDTFYGLEKRNHYELLRVPQAAGKKVVKKAYYDLVAAFHPDKYFGKSLGAFKPKLEKIFQRITEAHDTLTRLEQRVEYDRYLESQQATRALDAVQSEVGKSSLDEIRKEIEREARLAATLDAQATSGAAKAGVAPLQEPPSSPRAAPVIPQAGAVPRISSFPPATPADPGHRSSNGTAPEVRPRPAPTLDERRRALARKLGGSVPPPPRNQSSVPPAAVATGPSARELAGEALKRRYEARLKQALKERIQRYILQAEQSAASKNFVAAANSMRVALSLAPDDPEVAARFEDIDRQASAALADQYLEQARYDERRGHLLEAVQAYERVLRGRPSANVYERAAHCLLEARGDAKRAGEFARKAVELAPNETAYRITLARVYARAGMEQSAQGELERARALAPEDDTIKDWIKRLKRGEI
jgi:curved DNA-binding protein CbpA